MRHKRTQKEVCGEAKPRVLRRKITDSFKGSPIWLLVFISSATHFLKYLNVFHKLKMSCQEEGPRPPYASRNQMSSASEYSGSSPNWHSNKWTALLTAAISNPNSLTTHRYSAFLHSCKWPATVGHLFCVQRVSSHLRTSTVVAAHLSTSSTLHDALILN